MPDTGFESVVSMFERQVDAFPDKKAVAGDYISLTYSELNEYANRLANALIYYGAGREDIVMIFMPRNFMYYAVNLGVLKAGAAFITVSISYPPERISYICQDSGCKFLITSTKMYEQNVSLFSKEEVTVLFIEELLASQWCENPRVMIHENDLAYCIYTSGSTGKPKGVMIEHGNLSNFLEHDPDNREVMDIVENGTSVLAQAALTFDVSIMEEFIALSSGMCLVMATDEQILNPAALSKKMIANNVDVLMCTPSYLDMLLGSAAMKPALEALKAIDMGAEAFPGELYNKIRNVNPDVIIINGYGPTEATISCVSKRITSPENITIGKPASNVYCFIVDEKLNELPQGELGELLICGKGVGRGYKNLEEKTKEVFVSFRGMKAYRSGDLARIDENGEIDFHGRIDSQVKVRGLRIELQEVETIVSECEIVGRCAANAIDSRYLCLYYVTKDSDIQETEAKDIIRAYAKEHLAHYMMPDYFIRLDEMPVTANWKIDRKRLPRPEIKATEGQAPSTDMQKEIVALISDAIKRPFAAVDIAFIDEGLTSLDMMAIAAALGEKHRIPFTIADFVKCRNVLGVEQLITERQAEDAGKEVLRAPAMLNQSLYYEIWHTYNSTECVMPSMYKLDGAIDTERLIAAIRSAARVHPGIFARMEMGEDQYYIYVPEPEKLGKLADELEVTVHKCREDQMEEISCGIAKELMNPGSDRYYDFRIYETEQNKYFVTRFAHMLGDGESIEIFVRDVFKAYDGAELMPEELNIAQYSGEHYRRTGGSGDDSQDYFRKLLGDEAQWPHLTLDNPSEEAGFENYEKAIDLSEERIELIAEKLSVSKSILFAAVTTLALSVATGACTVPMVIAYSGRDDFRVKNTFGFLVKPVIICGHIDKNTTVGAYMHEISAQFFEGLSKGISLSEMYEEYPGWTDCLFIYQAETDSVHILQGKEVEEKWLSSEDEETFEEMEGASEEVAEGSYRDVFFNTALRWTTAQTSFEIFAGDEGYFCSALAPLGRNDSKLMDAVLDKVNGIISLLDNGDEKLTIGELTNG